MPSRRLRTARSVLYPPRPLARSRCCSSFPARSGALLPYICRGREAGLPGDRGTAVWVVPIVPVPGVPAFQAAHEDLDAPGRTIIVDPDPLEVRVESAALVPTMERLPVCPNADALPHE